MSNLKFKSWMLNSKTFDRFYGDFIVILIFQVLSKANLYVIWTGYFIVTKQRTDWKCFPHQILEFWNGLEIFVFFHFCYQICSHKSSGYRSCTWQKRFWTRFSCTEIEIQNSKNIIPNVFTNFLNNFLLFLCSKILKQLWLQSLAKCCVEEVKKKYLSNKEFHVDKKSVKCQLNIFCLWNYPYFSIEWNLSIDFALILTLWDIS